MATLNSNSYENPFTSVHDPVRVQGRLQGRKSHFICVVRQASDNAVLIRVDDKLNPGFWAEVVIDLPALSPVFEGEELHASDSRHAS